MNPAIIHADGTECSHPGPSRTSDDGPHCSADQLVTHVRFNGQVMTFDESMAAFSRIAEAASVAMKPAIATVGRLIAAFGEAVRSHGLRALVDAAEEGGQQ